MARFVSKSRSRVRILCVAVAVASVAAGIIAGCGIDVVGTFDLGTDSSLDTKPALPPGTDGSIVTDAGAGADADADAQLACADSLCVTNGGQCEDGGNDCIIECNDAGNCKSTITCPPDIGCRVVCAFDDTCDQKVDCTLATSCDITCSGRHTCNGIACAGTSCKVACTGFDSCEIGLIDCKATDSCTIGCTADGGMKNCLDAVTCTSAKCNVNCNSDGCAGGVTATTTGDASIICGTGACDNGVTCYSKGACRLGCKSSGCGGKMCCDAGSCVLDGGTNNCPP